ncbi:M23 family metallopeptidase [Marinicrinis lubricantis]|uniref:M23 family metallopeptidase n=1 Tax=Marinicrinis lubricantis TaxID=2086470 RepID=A0ABW1IPL7_9BACL
MKRLYRSLRLPLCVLLTITLLWTAVNSAQAAESVKLSPEQQRYERRLLFENISLMTGIPWYCLAAVDQYERTLSSANPKKYPKREGLIAIRFPDEKWAGPFNPNPQDTDLRTIRMFGGIGQDGDGDGKADIKNDTDVLYTFAMEFLQKGYSDEDFTISLWDYYHNPRSVKRIDQFAKIYRHFDTLELTRHVFTLPLRSNYSYRSTWGDARGWGGRRIHEGTDIFANHGVPVRSTSYGIIEIKGWNKYGGWRVGIRDIHNIYHYYAHLSGFNKGIEEGTIVQPGDVVGWVGSSGYGKPGTQGKFPPHLHYGLYRDSGLVDWSFDPYPSLKQWEREEYRAKRKK